MLRLAAHRARSKVLPIAVSVGRGHQRSLSSHIVTSPFPDVPPGPYPTLDKFVIENWGNVDPNKVACLDGITEEQRTFGEVRKDMDSVAFQFSEMGIKRGDAIALMSPNHVDYATIIFAAAKIGAIVTPMNPLYTPEELAFQLKSSSAKTYVFHEDCFEQADKAAKIYGAVDNMVVLGNGGASFDSPVVNFSALREANHPEAATKQYHAEASDTLLLPYSSGTTGLPKGVVLDHDNIVVNLHQMEACDNVFQTEDTITISPLPMFHIYGFSVSLLQQAWSGRTLVTMKNFDFNRYCELVDSYSKQNVQMRSHLVPPIVLGLAKNPVIDNYDFSGMDMIICAAAPLKPELEKEAAARLNCKIKQAWGMSELSPVGTCTPDDDLQAGSGTIGPLCANTEGKIIDPETGEDLPLETEGELCIRGPQVMQGYLEQPEKTKECITDDGWLLTGDLAKYDERGYFYILDRLKELIKYKGFQVAPAELEDVLMSHPEIADSTVIPVENDEAGEVPRAYVVLAEGSSMSEADIQEYVATKVAPHKKLRGGVVFTEAIPKTASGKILRRVVIAQDREERK